MHFATDGAELGQPLVETSEFSYFIGEYSKPDSFNDSSLKVCSSYWWRVHVKRVCSAKTVNPLKMKGRLLYLKTQFVSRSKHFSSRL